MVAWVRKKQNGKYFLRKSLTFLFGGRIRNFNQSLSSSNNVALKHSNVFEAFLLSLFYFVFKYTVGVMILNKNIYLALIKIGQVKTKLARC